MIIPDILLSHAALVILQTFVVMLAFAANSLLCRAALSAQLIDAGSFTFIRLASGAMTLLLLMCIYKRRKKSNEVGSLKVRGFRGVSLFGYALFSLTLTSL